MSWTYVQYFISFFNRKWFFGECSSRRSSQLKEMESPSSFLHDFLSNILYFNFNSNTFGNNSSNKGSWCMSKKSWSILLTIWNGSGLHGHTVVKIWINLMYHQLRFLDFFFISLWILDIYIWVTCWAVPLSLDLKQFVLCAGNFWMSFTGISCVKFYTAI